VEGNAATGGRGSPTFSSQSLLFVYVYGPCGPFHLFPMVPPSAFGLRRLYAVPCGAVELEGGEVARQAQEKWENEIVSRGLDRHHQTRFCGPVWLAGQIYLQDLFVRLLFLVDSFVSW